MWNPSSLQPNSNTHPPKLTQNLNWRSQNLTFETKPHTPICDTEPRLLKEEHKTPYPSFEQLRPRFWKANPKP